MKKKISMVVFCAVLAASASSWGQAIRIGGVGTTDPRSRIAVPDFVCAPGLEAVAREMTSALEFDLMFSGLFVTIPRQSFPPAFGGFTPDPTQIDFEVWRGIKVEYVVHAYVTQQGDVLVAECRMFDAQTGTQVVGQRLTTKRDLPRFASHRFSEEVIRNVEGVPGIATSRICFSTRKSKDVKELYVADYDGHNAKQITNFSAITILPKLSPDGTKVAFLSYKDRYPFLYVLDTASGRTTPLAKSVGLNAAPAWSPDGRLIAYVQSKDANPEIYIKNSDGSGERRVTRDKAADTSPCFDPAGKQIAFVSDRGGQPQIHVMDVGGGNVRRISFQGGRSYDPAWSPDGKSIAYVAERSGEGLEIYVAPVDGGSFMRMTDSAGSNEKPTWSADSRHIMFCSSRGGKPELWTVNVNPPYDQHRIDVNGMACEGPSWGPRR